MSLDEHGGATVGAPRSTAQVELPALRTYLDEVLPGGVDGDLDVELLSGGRSNPTFRLADVTNRWVLRRPPYGHVLPTAHDMGREYRVQTALAGTSVPVARTVVLCEDASVIGAPFYVMEMIDGVTLRDATQTGRLSVEQRRRLSEAMVDILVALHEVDPGEVGLAGWGRPAGYLERQLHRWRQQWQASATAPRREVDELLDLLGRSCPATRHPGIVHGDFKLDNLMVDPRDPAIVRGVLDWEMSTLGDTLTDVGILLSFWDQPGEVPNPISQGATALEGFLSREQMARRYAVARGLDLEDLTWYLVFADLKIGIILEGIHARHRLGQTVGEGFDGVGDMAGVLLQRAHERAGAQLLAP
ncbi:MAG: phosphotransferase family protein [Nitriliruptor sp.]|nr:MAG: phosphotransferase family protein [Nitriliruptor sp.]